MFRRATYRLILIISIICLSLSGCDSFSSKVKKTSKQQHLSNFINLQSSYCEKKFQSQSSLVTALQIDKKFSFITTDKKIYEAMMNKVSYAVTPDNEGCTTDVMLENQLGKPIFEFKDVDDALISNGYTRLDEEPVIGEVEVESLILSVMEQSYLTAQGEVAVLAFPLGNYDMFFMTLFIKKFSLEEKNSKLLKI